MKTKGAILRGAGRDWEIEEFDLGDPIAGEVQVRIAASGLCHSDHHYRSGDRNPPFFPMLGGHEGSGVVTKVGPGVTTVEEGDHVVLAFTPACGICGPCARGMQHLCDKGAAIGTGRAISDGSFRTTSGGSPVYAMALVGAFAPYVTVNSAAVIKIEKDIPLNRAALLGCGVCTGWGSATEAGGSRVGDTVVVVGCGGIGINAVQGAAHSGARFVIAIDPVEFKREQALAFGATHTFSSMAEAADRIRDLTWGQMSQVTVLTVGVMDGEMIQPALDLTAKGGTVVVTAVGPSDAGKTSIDLGMLSMLEKRIQGTIFGGASPRTQVPKLLNLYRSGSLKLDELVTRTYRLEDINQGYDDMLSGKNLRGVIEFSDADY